MNNRDRMRRWRKRNPERARRQGAKDRLRLKERDPDYHRRWYQENAEKERKRSREIMRKDRRDHPERERKRKRRYRAKHRAAIQMREREKTYARRALQPYSADLARLMSELMTQPLLLLRSRSEHHHRPYCSAVARRQARSRQPRSSVLFLQQFEKQPFAFRVEGSSLDAPRRRSGESCGSSVSAFCYSPPKARGRSVTAPTLPVARQFGLYLHPVEDARRISL
jgi:hypothetical protein